MYEIHLSSISTLLIVATTCGLAEKQAADSQGEFTDRTRVFAARLEGTSQVVKVGTQTAQPPYLPRHAPIYVCNLPTGEGSTATVTAIVLLLPMIVGRGPLLPASISSTTRKRR